MPILAMDHAGVTKEHTVVIGDRIYTDVKSGVNAGTISVLVLSGETTVEILNESDVKPDLVLDDCSPIIGVLR